MLYTYNFFVPWTLVTANTGTGSDERFPDTFVCREVYETWWHDFCTSAEQPVRVDASWVERTTREVPYALSRRFNVPVYCNQWGVKNELFASHGRLEYARVLLDAFVQHNVSSTYWIWRSYPKDDRPLDEPVWGFELVHNSGPREQPAGWVQSNLDTLESLDAEMTAVLQAGFPTLEDIPTEPKPPPPPPPLPPVFPPFAPDAAPPRASCPGFGFLRTRRTHLSGFAGGEWCSDQISGTEYDDEAREVCKDAWMDPATPDPPVGYAFDCSLGCSPCHYSLGASGAWVCLAAAVPIFPCPPPSPTPPPDPPSLEFAPAAPPTLPPTPTPGSSAFLLSLWGVSLPVAAMGLFVSFACVMFLCAALATLRFRRRALIDPRSRGVGMELGAPALAPAQPQGLAGGPVGHAARTKLGLGDSRAYARQLDDEAIPHELSAISERGNSNAPACSAVGETGESGEERSSLGTDREPLPLVDRAGGAVESGLSKERHRIVGEGETTRGAHEGPAQQGAAGDAAAVVTPLPEMD